MPKRVSRWQLIEQTRPCACEGIMVNCFQHNMIWPIRIVISVPLLLLFTLDQQGNPLAPVSEQSTILWLCFLSQWITCNLPLALSKTSRVTWEHVKNHSVFFGQVHSTWMEGRASLSVEVSLVSVGSVGCGTTMERIRYQSDAGLSIRASYKGWDWFWGGGWAVINGLSVKWTIKTFYVPKGAGALASSWITF